MKNRTAEIHAGLKPTVIDGDGHWLEPVPVFQCLKKQNLTLIPPLDLSPSRTIRLISSCRRWNSCSTWPSWSRARVHLRDYGLQKSEEEVIFDRAATEHRLVVSTDTDFGRISLTGRRQNLR